jgi:thioredoxin 2
MNTQQIVCPHCHTINAVPAARLSDQPVCGKCHKPIFNAYPLELNAAGFDRHLKRNDIPVLVDFWAPWCQPCLSMAPAFAEAAKVLEPIVRLVKLNTQEQQSIGAQHGIRSIPTLVLFRNGQEIARQSGVMMTGDIVRWTQEQLAVSV